MDSSTQNANVHILKPSDYHVIKQPAYFFSNHIIDDFLSSHFTFKFNQIVFIAQHCETLENALYVIDMWNKYHKNLGIIEIDNIDNQVFRNTEQLYDKNDFFLHVYSSNKKIECKQIGNGDNMFNVLAFRINDNNYYIALLPFEYIFQNVHYRFNSQK
jgi:hypothetical protein